jgi:hypothetical protein
MMSWNSKPVGYAASREMNTATFAVRASTRSNGTVDGSVPSGGPAHAGVR